MLTKKEKLGKSKQMANLRVKEKLLRNWRELEHRNLVFNLVFLILNGCHLICLMRWAKKAPS